MACSVMSLRQGSPDSFKAYVLDGQLFSLKFQAAGTNKNKWKKKNKVPGCYWDWLLETLLLSQVSRGTTEVPLFYYL